MPMLRNSLYAPWFGKENEWGFHLIDGKFNDVVVQIQDMKMEEKDDGNLSLEYHVISKPEGIADEDIKSEEFKGIFQLVVNDIVKEAIEFYEQKDDRSNNPQELDPQ